MTRARAAAPAGRTTASADAARVLADLRELIEALDRRVPQLHRKGERAIASDAAVLRKRAEARIAAIERSLDTTRGR